MAVTKKTITIILITIWIIFSVIILFNEKNKNSGIVESFPNCKALVNACNDSSCRYYFLCNEMENLNCNVYDCGDKYGMEILNKQGNIQKKTRQKPDQTKVQEVVSKCRGSLEVLERKCEGDKSIAQVKVTTDGDCKISSFIMVVEGKSRIARFEKEGDIYNLSVGQCGFISEIKAVGEGGVEIK